MRAAAARTRLELVRALDLGARPEFVFFWGHRPPAAGAVGPSALSQFYAAAFELGGERYATAEHWMMAEKARLFGDAQQRRAILHSVDPDEAKRHGRRVRAFDEERWAAARWDIVVAGNEAKFGQSSALRSFLLGTGERVLVEASPLDPIWGAGVGRTDPRAPDPRRWPGENLLGFALMEVRERLRRAH